MRMTSRVRPIARQLGARVRALLVASPRCWVPISANALGGIIAGQVIKLVGGVRRSFGVIAGIMLTGVAEFVVFGVRLSPRLWFCVPAIVAAIYMYAAVPPKRKAQ